MPTTIEEPLATRKWMKSVSWPEGYDHRRQSGCGVMPIWDGMALVVDLGSQIRVENLSQERYLHLLAALGIEPEVDSAEQD